MDRTFLLIGSLLGSWSAIGAFGAHALKSRLSPEMLGVFETAVRYQMYHAFRVADRRRRESDTSKRPSAGVRRLVLLAGVLLFSGSLYALGAHWCRRARTITPSVGCFFLIGWGCLVFYAAAR